MKNRGLLTREKVVKILVGVSLKDVNQASNNKATQFA